MLFTIDRLLPQMITQLKIMTDQTFDDMINVETISTRPADDFFYIRTEAFDNEDVKTGMTLTMSPDGKAARFTVAHEGNAMEYRTCRSVPRRHQVKADRDLVGRLQDLHRGGTSNNKDIKEYAASDLLIVAIAAFVPIFLIMFFITRSLMADQAPAAQSARGARKQPSKCPFSMPAICMNE